MNRKTLFHALALVACLLCSVSAMADEPYAAYNAADKTLTFYYDARPSGYQATAYYDLNSGSTPPDWFYDETCKSVTHVVFHWSFAQARPTSTYAWFLNMTNLESITGINRLHTEDVTNMAYMFYGCEKLSQIDLSYFNTANVTNMYGMFYGCSSLSQIDLASFNTANVTNMGGMFRGCSALETIDLASFNTGKVAKTSYMFYQCGNLATIYADKDWCLDNDNISTSMFEDCVSLVGCMGTTYDVNHTDGEYAHVDWGTENPGYFSDHIIDEPKAYANYTSADSTLTFYFDNLSRYREGKTFNMNTGDNDPEWLKNGSSRTTKTVIFAPSFVAARPTTTFKWFYGMTNLRDIVDMKYLNTSQVTDMGGMFFDCHELTSIDVSNFNTSQVTYMSAMFNGCYNLTSLDLTNFNTENVTEMVGMFRACLNLESLDVSSFNTSQVTAMFLMFCGCVKLTSLDLSSFNTAMVREMDSMFYGDTCMTTIYVGNAWSTDAVVVSGSMFDGCKRLVGGKGTRYDADHVDVEYAHIDCGTSNPGYFTPVLRRGDVNGDNIVEIGDVSDLIDYLISGNTSNIYFQTADVDADGRVTIGDVATLIDCLLNGGW